MDSSEEKQQPDCFVSTHWSVVLTAGDVQSPKSEQALEVLCRTYWYPLYAYIRRRGYSHEDATDLTQEFFARLLRKNYLANLDREKGKFRSFLLASMKHFLANEWDRLNSQKRGGGRIVQSLDDESFKQRYLLDAARDEPVEMVYDRQWALTVLERGLQALKTEWETAGKELQFDRLKPFLTAHGADAEYAEIAAQLKIKPASLAVAIHRMRQRYRELVRAEVANTTSNPADIDDEMRYLLTVLRA